MRGGQADEAKRTQLFASCDVNGNNFLSLGEVTAGMAGLFGKGGTQSFAPAIKRAFLAARGSSEYAVPGKPSEAVSRPEFKALLVYLEAEFDESIDDKEKLVRLVVNQKNAVGMAKRHAKTLLRWRERSRGESAQAGELPAVRESEVMPILAEDDAGEAA